MAAFSPASLGNDEADLVQSYKKVLAKKLAKDILEDQNERNGEPAAKGSSEKEELKKLINEVLRELDDSKDKAISNTATTRTRKAVKDAEDVFVNDWNCYKKVQAKKLWDDYLKTAETTNEHLQKIGQSLNDFIARQMDSQKDQENNKCLRDLYVVNPLDDMAAIEEEKRTVMRQRIQQPHLIEHLRAEHKASSENVFKGDRALQVLSRLFSKIVEKAKPAYLLIDAFDECDHGKEELLSVVFNLPSQLSHCPTLPRSLEPDWRGTLL